MLLFFNAAGRMTGSLIEAYPAPAEVIDRVKANAAQVIDVPDFEARYWTVENGELKIRPRLALTVQSHTEAGGQDVTIITGVPAGGVVRVIGPQEGEIEGDGEPVELVFQNPGQYRVSVSADPYQPQEFDVTVGGSNGAA